jgi:hypothetical protein
MIKCINFIRAKVKAGSDPLALLLEGPQVFQDDKFLKPVLLDDGLLFHDFTEYDQMR